MSRPDRHQRLTELFAKASELSPEARTAFLGQLARDDAGLHADLCSLLAIDDDDGDDWLEPESGGLAAQLRAPVREQGERIGSYEVERLIGSGGAGDVYVAHQQRPRRLVAVKVMRHGLVAPARVRKFEFEAQLLARLKHAGIAQVFEADVFEDRGVHKPFFVMEYVEDAATLTSYADARGLDVPARLRLFASVCDAVAHGHQHRIAHCDLKPENVLVSPDGQAKVIDFGIARAADRDPNLTTMQTGSYTLAGTLPYMSPEQASGAGLDLDARTDVYSLGAMLYELLTGTLPLDLAGLSIPSATRRILEDRVPSLASRDPRLRGDLDTIVGKCLEKDRERRYRDAGELARDIQRFLKNEPIHARRPTALYQLRKFTRRHRGLVFGSALAVVALLVGSGIAIERAVVATRGEARSRWEAYRASIAAAGAALANHDVAQARANLDSAPAEHRNWEWHHLRARLDDSLSSVDVPGDGMLGSPAFRRLGGRPVVGVVRAGRAHFYDVESGASVEQMPAQHLASDAGSDTLVTVHDGVVVAQREGAVRFSREVAALGLAGPVLALRVSRGGRFAVLLGADSVLRVDLEQQASQVAAIDSGRIGVTSIAVSHLGTVVLAAGVDGRGAIWRSGSEQVEALKDLRTFVRSVAFHPNGRWIAVGLQDTTIGLWDADSGERVMRADGHSHAVTGIAFSVDGDYVLSASLDRTLRIWGTAGLAPLAVKHGHSRGIRQVESFRGAGAGVVATCGEDGTLRIWEGRDMYDHGALVGHWGLVFPTAYSPDGRLVASAGTDGGVRIWSATTHEQVARIPLTFRSVTALAFAADGSRLVAAGDDRDGGVRLAAFDLDGGARLADVPLPAAAAMAARELLFDAAAERVFVPMLRDDRRVPCVDVATGAVSDAPLDEVLALPSRYLANGGRYAVLAVADGGFDTVHRADSDSGTPKVVYDTREREVVSLPALSGAFTWLPDGHTLAARLEDRDLSHVALFDVRSGERLATIDGHSDRIYGMACSPDGSRLVTAARDAVRVWSCDTPERAGDRLFELEGHTSFVWSIQWSPTTAQLVTGSGDRSVRLWGVESARDVRTARVANSSREQRFRSTLAERGGVAGLQQYLRSGAGDMEAFRRDELRRWLLAERSWR